MHKLFFICGFTGLMVASSCSEKAGEEYASEANKTEADTVAKPVSAEITEDSTLQPIEEITLKATGNTEEEMAFNKDTIKVPAGALVKLEFINEGTEIPMIHNFVVADAGTYKAVALAGEKVGSSGNYTPPESNLLAASPLALPGQTVLVEFQAPLQPATYDFVCTYPGHWKKMHGTLIVK